ncbi:MAG: purine-nucleoside phosphorylase [Gemmatimonadaceae bacterium]|nr:purine-nucleoside phosphorylase [Gemmatimonadaceae bacterium]NUQ94215.1 purine-nucleoside phosphorylase [Gemmatimonadaceae bacterium]NUR20597.1 purine-nucleoside phosphorylase [Gemmatimonadaceae bacterium]NUS98875.1 purine-nucleoside phosphorylase [Gemmatimonadaceae bacterium]
MTTTTAPRSETVTVATHTVEAIEAAASAVRARFTKTPAAAIILGTGLGALAREIAVESTIEYRDIPGFPLSTVESHAGRLLCGTLGGKPVVAMQGRFHRYEGYTLQQVTFPVRVLHALGAPTLVVSNACGGMNPLWAPGDLMLIADHLNLLGDNPLVGANDDRLGPRFPDMSEPYDAALRAIAREVALKAGITLREGVYVAVAGPNLETRAEYRMLRTLGADVVGMSTVPEVIVARHAGMRVLGLSIITDQCLPDALEPATLEKILGVAAGAEPKLTAVVRGVLERL